MSAVLASRALTADDLAMHLSAALAVVAVLFAVATLVFMAWPVRRPNPPRPAASRLTGAAAIRATTVYRVTTMGPRPRPSDPTVILRHRRGGRRAH